MIPVHLFKWIHFKVKKVLIITFHYLPFPDWSFLPNPSFPLFIFKIALSPTQSPFLPRKPAPESLWSERCSTWLRHWNKLRRKQWTEVLREASAFYIVLLWTEIPMCGILIASFMWGMDDYLPLQPKDPIPPSLSIWGINSQKELLRIANL